MVDPSPLTAADFTTGQCSSSESEHDLTQSIAEEIFLGVQQSGANQDLLSSPPPQQMEMVLPDPIDKVLENKLLQTIALPQAIALLIVSYLQGEVKSIQWVFGISRNFLKAFPMTRPINVRGPSQDVLYYSDEPEPEQICEHFICCLCIPAFFLSFWMPCWQHRTWEFNRHRWMVEKTETYCCMCLREESMFRQRIQKIEYLCTNRSRDGAVFTMQTGEVYHYRDWNVVALDQLHAFLWPTFGNVPTLYRYTEGYEPGPQSQA